LILGAQLYTIRSYTQTEEDFDYSLEQIAKIGYTTVQISAIGGSIKPQTVKELCDKHNLKIVITHSDPNRILNDTDQLIKDHKLMGCKYIGLGSMPDKYRNPEWIDHFSKDYKAAAVKIKEAGMLLMYHNHNFEFEKVNGKYYIEYLMEAFEPGELGFTLDTYWLQAAGTDVCQWIQRLKDRIPCVHLKDMAMVRHEAVMAPVLEGNMNFVNILKTLEDTNCEYILVEQDVCQESPFECLKKSYDNLSALGYR
jgi:sugar phosphate isomerase/epimerase